LSAKYLLDTNIVSALLRYPSGPVGKRVDIEPDDAIVTSVVVAGELRFGTERVGNAAFSARIAQVIELFPVLPLEAATDRAYAQIRASLEKMGKPIGANDLWIAAHTLSLGLTLVTDNVGEFERVEGLRIENWLRG
jgi:tRNA(fMet)-specific endonuclease VapC